MVKKSAVKKAAKKSPAKKSETLTRSDAVITPVVVWFASDFDRLPPEILARAYAALAEVTGVPVTSISVCVGQQVMT